MLCNISYTVPESNVCYSSGQNSQRGDTKKENKDSYIIYLYFLLLKCQIFFIPWVFRNDPNQTFDCVQLTPSV